MTGARFCKCGHRYTDHKRYYNKHVASCLKENCQCSKYKYSFSDKRKSARRIQIKIGDLSADGKLKDFELKRLNITIPKQLYSNQNES